MAAPAQAATAVVASNPHPEGYQHIQRLRAQALQRRKKIKMQKCKTELAVSMSLTPI